MGASGTGAQEKIHPHESMGPRRGPDRPRDRRGGRVEPVAIPADQRARRTSKREGGPPKLGDMEKPPRSPTHLQIDPDAHGTWHVRRVPDENRTGEDGHLSPLRAGQGYGAAHAGVFSGVGAAPLYLASRHRRETEPLCDRRNDAERATGIRGCPPLLLASYARKEASRKGEKEKLSPL